MEHSNKQGGSAGGQGERKPRERTGEDNIIQVSSRRNANFYVYLAKKILGEHETIQFHALGNAVSIGVIAAENLARYIFLISNLPN